MTQGRSVALVSEKHHDVVLAQTLASAFQDDPAMAWILPDPAARKVALPKLFKIMIRSDRRAGWVLGSSAQEACTL